MWISFLFPTSSNKGSERVKGTEVKGTELF